MNSYRVLGLMVATLFVLLGLGAYLSPTYTQQMNNAQGFLIGGALLFVVSVVIIVSAVGLHAFMLYLAVLTAMAIAAFGIYGGMLVWVLTYLSWGFVFAVQLLLVHHRVPSAIDWFRMRYNATAFYAEYRAFYPMLWLMYFLLDLIPHLLLHEHLSRFQPQETFRFMQKILLKK